MNSNLHQLVEAARGGDKTAAVGLIEEFHARVYAFLRRLAGNEADAADLTQRTFSRVWQALASFEGRSSLASWIHGIAYHVYVDWRRTDHRTESRSDDWWAARPAGGAPPDELAARADLAATLYRLVDRLEPGLREGVHLHYYQGLTLEETAGAMGVAVSTVKYRLRLALGYLHKELDAAEASH
jgi:RNA polymerase sigma-70 factor (ECF subfamily)